MMAGKMYRWNSAKATTTFIVSIASSTVAVTATPLPPLPPMTPLLLLPRLLFVRRRQTMSDAQLQTTPSIKMVQPTVANTR